MVITIAWATSFIVSIANPKYQPPSSLQPLMMLVAGAAFANSVLGKRDGKDKP